MRWSIRRDDLCDPDLQPGCERGAHGPDCPVTRLDETLQTSAGTATMIARAFDKLLERDLAGWLDIASLPADVVAVMKVIKVEQGNYERERYRDQRQQPRTRN